MNELINFEGQQIRQTEYEGETYFSLIDVVAALTNNSRPNKYWSDLKVRLRKEGFEVSDYIGRLKMIAPDGKSRSTDCANRETILRIIQSIPSLKSEPFKQWMAQVGEQRLQEIKKITTTIFKRSMLLLFLITYLYNLSSHKTLILSGLQDV